MCTAVMGVELDRWQEEELKDLSRKNFYNQHIYFSLIMCSVSSAYFFILLIGDYFYYHDIMFQEQKISDIILRKQLMAILELIITLLLAIPHPNLLFHGKKYERHILKYNVDVTYSINSILMVFCLFRIWYVIKFYLVNSEFYNPQCKRICSMSQVENTFMFTLKSKMQKSSFEVYGLLFLVCVIFFCITIRNFEMKIDNVSEINYSYFIHVICITMLTVGYGDFFPSTFEGRTFSITSGVIGICMISMMIVSVTNMINFLGNEKGVFNLIERLEINDSQRKQSSQKLIASYIKLMKTLLD